MSNTELVLKKMLTICERSDKCGGCPLDKFCGTMRVDAINPEDLKEAADAIDLVELDGQNGLYEELDEVEEEK